MKVWIQKVKYQKDTGLCSWIVLQNLQGFSEIFIFSFAIYVVFILNCGSLLLFLSCVVITHLFFIFSVVNHLELREISTSQSDLGSSLYAICDGCGLSEFLATGDHNCSDDAPWTVQGKNLITEWFMLPVKWELAEKMFPSFVKYWIWLFPRAKITSTVIRMPCFKLILRLSRLNWRKTRRKQGSWQW